MNKSTMKLDDKNGHKPQNQKQEREPTAAPKIARHQHLHRESKGKYHGVRGTRQHRTANSPTETHRGRQGANLGPAAELRWFQSTG